MKSTIRRLPDAELEVMQAIWAYDPPVARNDIEQLLHDTHPMAQTTLLTLLTRLSEKGFLTIEKIGRRSYYTPRILKQDYLASQSRSFFEKLCGSNISTFASALCDSGISKEDLEELRDLLERGNL